MHQFFLLSWPNSWCLHNTTNIPFVSRIISLLEIHFLILTVEMIVIWTMCIWILIKYTTAIIFKNTLRVWTLHTSIHFMKCIKKYACVKPPSNCSCPLVIVKNEIYFLSNWHQVWIFLRWSHQCLKILDLVSTKDSSF